MAQIEINKVVRDCPYNQKLAGQKGARLIYDFHVIIDGEHRAYIRSNGSFGSRAYSLVDLVSCPINVTSQAYGGNVISHKIDLSAFHTVVERMLEAGKIPTVAVTAAYRAAQHLEAVKREAERFERQRVAVIEAAGLPLYEALKKLIGVVEAVGLDPPSLTLAREAIALAEGARDNGAEGGTNG